MSRKPGSYFDHNPFFPRKGGMPLSTDMPEPVNATVCAEYFISSAACIIMSEIPFTLLVFVSEFVLSRALEFFRMLYPAKLSDKFSQVIRMTAVLNLLNQVFLQKRID